MHTLTSPGGEPAIRDDRADDPDGEGGHPARRAAARRHPAAQRRGPAPARAPDRPLGPLARRARLHRRVRRGRPRLREDAAATRGLAGLRHRPGQLDRRGLVPPERRDAARSAVDDVRSAGDVRRHAHPRLCGRVHGARRGPSAVLRVPEPVHRGDAHARAGQQLPAAVLRLGGRRTGVVPAHRVLELPARLRGRRQEGIHRQPHRRPRAHHRDGPDVCHVRQRELRPGARWGRSWDQPGGRQRHRDHVAARGLRQVSAVPAAVLARRRHGRPDARVSAHPRGHHGDRGRLPHRALGAAVQRGARTPSSSSSASAP